MSEHLKIANELIDFIYKSPTAFHATENSQEMLEAANFQQIELTNKWKLQKGGKYYVKKNNSSIFAFVIGKSDSIDSFRIVGAHTDSPCLKIKPNPEILSEGFLKLNTEVYGGPILNTWFDRPLSLAGRVIIKEKDSLIPKTSLININEPIMVIPNIAIHMNREVNNGVAVNNQKELLPIIQTVSGRFEKNNFLLNLISKTLKIDSNDILDFDLYLYEYEKGCVIGLENEFISSPRLDDLEAVEAGINSIINSSHNENTINLMACYDNEEVGSTTKQGANSQLLSNILERIIISLSGTRDDFLRIVSNSIMISVDGAHSIHPNISEKCDITNKPVINQGPVIKISANQKYTSDAESTAIYQTVAEKAGAKYQKFVNHSNERGGSTIGPISSSHLEIRSVDIGVPTLAMHSIRELCGTKDHEDLIKTLTEFYKI